MCKLPDGVANLEVVDLKERIKHHVSQALQYACRSWHKHLVDATPAQTGDVVPVLRRFLEEKFLFWLEVLSVLGAAREAVDALEATAKWLEVCPISLLVCLERFTEAVHRGHQGPSILFVIIFVS